MSFTDRIPTRIKLKLRPLARSLLAGPGIFAERYVLEDNSYVTLYTDDATLLPDYAPRCSLREHLSMQTVQVSLIVSAKDEEGNVAQWWKSILHQSRLPDEIIMVDAGSKDGTVETIGRLAASSSVPFRITIEPGANIARARNIAVARARFPIIAVTDLGCLPRPDWLEKLLIPFVQEPELRVAAGMYEAVDREGRPNRRWEMWRALSRVSPQVFLASSRSIAFSKRAWQAVGGYPEWLTLTGEDTYFDLELKRHGGKWAFVPEAIVEWSAPDTVLSHFRKVHDWAVGDGESGVHARYYWGYVLWQGVTCAVTLLSIALASLLAWLRVPSMTLWLLLVFLGWILWLSIAARRNRLSITALPQESIAQVYQILGFLKGARWQAKATERRLAAVKGTFFILSGVPIDDTGGGARCTQIALELIRQGYAVIFINKFPKYESKALGFKIAHPNLLVHSFSEFNWNRFVRDHGNLVRGKFLAGVIEFPLEDYLPLMRDIRASGGVMVYDLLDAWDTQLGGRWYSAAVEKQVIDLSHVLVATVPLLVKRLSQMSGRSVTLLPNAVNDRLFDPKRRNLRPADLPIADWTAIYTGALWGEWFDWDLVIEIAKHYPTASVVMIGDYQGQCKNPPANLHFLGLKEQRELPAYLAYADVAIVPWKVNAITHATSPLKVYEYLAMHRPVVAPDIEPLKNVPGVYRAQDSDSFLRLVSQARRAPFQEAAVDQFITPNTWQERVITLRELVNRAPGPNATQDLERSVL